MSDDTKRRIAEHIARHGDKQESERAKERLVTYGERPSHRSGN